MKKFYLIILLVLFLSGCAKVTPKPSEAVDKPTVTTSVSLVASETAIKTPVTVEPITQPPVLPLTSTPDAQQQMQASILPLVAPCDFADNVISYSPSGAWVMVTCLGDKPNNGPITKLARVDGSKQWNISFAEAFSKPYNRTDVNAQKSFFPVRWTKNEDFVYLSVQTSNENTLYKGSDGLFRMDLSSGKIRPTLNPAIAPLIASYVFQFSPSGTKLAYINQIFQPITIVLYDTQTGKESKIALDARFNQGGSLLWSQDEKLLLVSVFDQSTNGGNSVIVYNLETMENESVVHQSKSIYLPLGWVDKNTIYAESYPDSLVYIDLMTTNISPITTPAPVVVEPTSTAISNLPQQPTEVSSKSILPTEIIDSKGVKMQLVPSGKFTMGSENGANNAKPVHQVYLDAYYLDTYEVTNALYKACVDAGKCTPPKGNGSYVRSLYYGEKKFVNYPVVNVDWDQAITYCKWRGASLPTEAQWEKAARGTDGRTYPWGEGINGQANLDTTTCGCGDTIRVGHYRQDVSPYGVYDLAGNVMEWVADWYDSDYYQHSPIFNPSGPAFGGERVVRGGAWDTSFNSTSRYFHSPSLTSFDFGFRCASSP